MADRRTSRGGPGGSRRPGTRANARPRVQPTARPNGAPATARPRLTGRAAILVLVLAVLTVSYASSMRAYLQQRAHITELKEQIAQREVAIDDLEREKRRWDDPAYVQAQARERFGYLMPGETSYVVLGTDGKPLEAATSLSDPATVLARTPTAWWTHEWRSIELAGHPPAPQAPPLTKIDGSKQ
ncbi:septum formation initiator family protein [Nocardioides sp.]|uniref:FtsB family cell division protein n=1 Tax=Nocardioides sp. TaxID=35761 RepID=UPI003568A9A5